MDNPARGFENPSYDFESDGHIPVNPVYFDNESVYSSNVSQQHRTATIGRSTGKSPVPASSPKIPRSSLNPPAGVYIPPPDYSPPSTPRLKSAMKPTSHYDNMY